MGELTDEERSLIVRAFRGWEIDCDQREFEALLQTSEGLHLYAKHYNWDDGPAEMLKIIRNPSCDLGTAIMIYWSGGPGWDCQYTNRSEVSVYERDTYDLLREIEERVGAGFYRRQSIRFDPRDEDGHDYTQRYADVECQRQIPLYMYAATPGESLEVKGVEE